MKIKQRNMTVLLVFAKEDAQSDGFWWAAERMGYKCNIVRTAEGALESYLDKHHDVIIIDHRHSKGFDADALCRSIRAIKASDQTVLVAAMKRHTSDKEEPSILPLLNVGFNKRYVENHNIGACLNELLTLEHGEVKSRLKLRYSSAIFAALDSTSDAVEIINEDNEVQYVNHAYERLTGYSSEEILGNVNDVKDLPRNEKNKMDTQDTIRSQLRKGKYWEGTCYMRRKNGESLPHHCRITPVFGPAGLCYCVSVRHSTLDMTSHIERTKDTELSHIANGGIHAVPRRRESVARIHSMTIEAPITKVINMINSAQENSTLSVSQALDRVLEILRGSELYSPYLTPQMKDEDPMATEFVGGLMSQGGKRRFSANDVNITKTTHHVHIPSVPMATLRQIPDDIRALLDGDANWDLNVIQVEKLTAKRPLVYLGAQIFNRFGVCQFLNISESCLINWLQMVEANYHSRNTYHNSTHAADVLHATAYFLARQNIKAVFDQMDEVASLIAAVIHDIDHPGRTNAFLVNAGNDLAVLYNDLAVLESHHVACAFQMTSRDDSMNIFKNMERDDFRTLRQSIIDMVLATEMTRHFEHVSKFVNCINAPPNKIEEDVSSLNGQGSPENMSVANPLSTPENRTLIKRMLIKCADVSNPTRSTDLCIEWAYRIAEEYFQQNEDEKAKGLPVVMTVYDRKTCNIPKSQVSFIDYFINGMFDSWDLFSEIPILMENLQQNYQYWKEQDELQGREGLQPLDEEVAPDKT